MSVVLRSPCPACRKPLSIPADWVGQALRCKHCGNYLASRRKPKAAPTPQAAPQAAPLPHVAPLPTPQAAPIWEPLPEYTPPMPTAPMAMPAPMVAPMPTAYPSAAPVAGGYVSAFDAGDRYAGKGNYRGGKKNVWLKPVVFGLFVVALLSGAGIVYKMNPGLFNSSNDDPHVANNDKDKKDGDKKDPSATAKSGDVTGAFPRRLLAISVHEYLYANSLNKGVPSNAISATSTNTDICIRRLADRWRIPKEQFYHLTDMDVVERKADPKKAGRSVPVVSTAKYLPMKNVMEGAIASFIEGSREQDRIILMYCGHAIEKDGAVYLTPMEGDFEDLESLVPLKKVYDQLAACKAQEKLVIFDVCRFDVERGADRPHAGPMSEALEKGLHDAPEGVSVLTSCSKGEHSYEQDYAFERGHNYNGSFFLTEIEHASMAGFLVAEGNKLPAPGDVMPVERFLAYEMEHLPRVSQKFSGKLQTPKLTLKRKPDAVAYNPNETQPARFEYPTPPPSADPKLIRELLEEILLPPVKQARQDAGGIPVNLPFKKETLEEYLDDKQKPTEEFKKIVLAAVDKMREIREAGSGKELRETFSAETSDAAKKLLQEDQKTPALVESDLREQYDILKELAKDRDKQPKRWQAHYDYVYSQVLYRICYVNQYNLALANVRTGKIPDLGPGQDGYRLTAETALDKTTVKEYKQWYDEAKKLSNDLAKNYAGTPWSLLGKSDRSLNLGLRVSPATTGTGTSTPPAKK